MKKLKLSSLQLGAKELLSREQLKTIMGGDSGSGGSGGAGAYTSKCTASCKNNITITCYGYNGVGCAATDNSGCSGNDANGNSYYLTC